MNRDGYNVAYSSPVPKGVILEKNVPATMRDGVKLSLDIYKSAGDIGPSPVILAYSSFQKERFFESAKPAFYCPRGMFVSRLQREAVDLG
jgi:predicted acyl esterase